MLKRLFITVVLTLLFAAPLDACSCMGHSASFSLADYDRAHDVVEIKFLKGYLPGLPYEEQLRRTTAADSLRAAHQREGERTSLVPPPTVPRPIRNEVLFRGVIL